MGEQHMRNIADGALHQHPQLTAGHAGQGGKRIGQKKRRLHLALDGQARCCLMAVHRLPLNGALGEIRRLQQAQSDQFDVLVFGQRDSAAGFEVFDTHQTRLGARGNHHLVVMFGRSGKRNVAPRANHVGCIKRVGVDQIGLVLGQQLRLLQRVGWCQEVQAHARAALQCGVEHVPARKALRGKVGSNQKIKRHDVASSASHCWYTGTNSLMRVRDGLRRTEVKPTITPLRMLGTAVA